MEERSLQPIHWLSIIKLTSIIELAVSSEPVTYR